MRKVSGMLLVVLMALLLAACGNDDGDDEPTAEATQPAASTEAVESIEATEAPTESAVANDSTPASNSAGVASPVATPAVVASPVIVASPAAMASPAASPIAASPVAGGIVPITTDAPSSTGVHMTGTVTLPGAENETYVMASDGCVGIGTFAGMQPGRQVVVRNEAGEIIGVSTLQAAPDSDGCAWLFSLDVPESAFYAVSIPMVVEHVFASEDVEQNGGNISIPLT